MPEQYERLLDETCKQTDRPLDDSKFEITEAAALEHSEVVICNGWQLASSNVGVYMLGWERSIARTISREQTVEGLS